MVLHWLKRLRPEFRDLEEIYTGVYEGRQFDAVYANMLVLSCLIALLGLLVNSPAVIIGAMLISPLMGPILSCGLALTLAEWDLGRKAVRNLGFSVLEAIIIAAVATLLSPLKEATPEILARSNPNLMDLLIAFFSGVAGVLALTSRRMGLTIIPGVAIATAVMPPLATVGYGVATGQWGIAGGSFLLFFTNLTAIVISADLIFLWVGFRPRHKMLKHEHKLLVRYRIVAATVILLLISIPLVRTLFQAASQARTREAITATLRSLEKPGKSRLSGVEFHVGDDSVAVAAVLHTTEYVELAQVRQVEAALAARLGRHVRLRLEQIRVEEDPAGESRRLRDFLASAMVRPTTAPELARTAGTLLSDVQSKVEAALQPLLAPLGLTGGTVQMVGRQADDSIVVEVTASAPQPGDPRAWAVAATSVANELRARVNLRVRVRIVPPDGQPADIISFAARSALPQSASLVPARQWLEPLRDRSDLVVRLVASPATEQSLTARRIAALRRRLAIQLSDEPGSEEALAADTLRIEVVQEISVTGSTGAAPAASPAPATPAPQP
ncbi:MAG TPA: DUF389 domain-containing protein [Terriglobales bacterium]|nr:DUF389 domain-containing protein [Terriglobales bacterium]